MAGRTKNLPERREFCRCQLWWDRRWGLRRQLDQGTALRRQGRGQAALRRPPREAAGPSMLTQRRGGAPLAQPPRGTRALAEVVGKLVGEVGRKAPDDGRVNQFLCYKKTADSQIIFPIFPSSRH